VYAAVGIHPCHAHECGAISETLSSLRTLLDGDIPVTSIGEVGLDFYHSKEHGAVQREYFSAQIALAKEYQLPLIIHSRDAFSETYELLAAEAAGHRVVIHCFTGTAEQATAWVELGFLLSLTGIITYPSNQELRNVVAGIPLSSLMLETDSPYLAPQGFRGAVAEPQYVRQVAECVAQIHDVTVEEVDRVTTGNAEQFFGLR
jgi:TatD DNase family protein